MATDPPSPPLHERVAAVLDEAGDLTGPALLEFVRRARGDDAELIAEVDRLMSDHTPGLLDRGLDAVGIGAAVRAAADDALNAADSTTPLESIGAYRIIREIGRGGMGVVYEAEQAEPNRRVAIKVIGSMTRDAAARLRREAAVMGRLRHPGIAHVFEAAHDPRVGPYIVMEYVEGQGLIDFVEANHYSVRQRVALLAAICDAVHAAHQRGIIHRDIKPSNVLVETLPGGTPSAKVLDFGVAQLTDPDLNAATISLTRPIDGARIVGTLAYMSPEAIDPALEPDGVDIRTDVYALGVLLYQLVAQRLPIDVSGAGLTEAARRVLSVDPPPLDQSVRAARGDLSVIAATALEKQRSRRYASAAALAADLRRYLANQPIAARPPTVTYQLRKLASRHKGLAWGIGAAAASLTLGAVLATLFAFSENRQRVRAEAALSLAERRVYAASIAAAARATVQSDAAAARGALAQAPEPLRGWEWSYLDRRADGTISAAPPVAGTSLPIGLTPDGHVITVFASSLAIIDPTTWATIASIPIAPPPRQFAVSPDRRLIAHWAAGSLRVLDTESLTPLWTHPGVTRLERAAFSTANELIAHTHNGLHTTIFDARSGEIRADLDALSPPGAGVFFGADASLWYEVAFGQHLAARRRDDGAQLWTTSLSGTWRSLPGSKSLAIIEEDAVQLVDAATGAPTRRINLNGRGALTLAGSSADPLLAVSERHGAISIWSTATGNLITVLLGHVRGSESVFLPDGELVSGSVDGSLRRWNPAFSSQRSIVAPPERISTARLAPHARRVIALGWGSILGWDLTSGAPEYSTFAGRTRGPSLIVVSPDGDKAFCSGWADGPCIVNIAAGIIEQRFPAHSDAWAHGQWSSEGLLLLTPAGRLTWFDLNGQPSTDIDSPPIRTLASRRAGGFLLAATDGSLYSWSRTSPLSRLGDKHDRPWAVLADLPDRAIACADDTGLVVMLDQLGVEQVRSRVPGAVTALALSPDRARLAAFTPGALHLLDTATGDIVLSLDGPVRTTDAAFSPDGGSLLAAGLPPLTIYSTRIEPSSRAWYLAQEGATLAVAAYNAAQRQISADVRDRIRADALITPAVKDAAFRSIDVWADPVPVLNSECWAVAVAPAATKEDAERAVRAMRHLCRTHADWHLHNTLAFCLYRAGRYDEALAAFEQSIVKGEQAGARDPTDAAGIAMTLSKLGRDDEAHRWLRTALDRTGDRIDPLVLEAQRQIQPR